MKVTNCLPAFMVGLIVVGCTVILAQRDWIAFAESPREIRGSLQMEVIETRANAEQFEAEASTQVRYFVQSWDGANFRRTYLAPKQEFDLPALLHQEVILRGRGTDHRFLPSSITGTEITRTEELGSAERQTAALSPTVGPFTTPTPTLGSRTALFLLAYHGNTPTTSYTPAQIKQWGMTGEMSANRFFQASSFGQFSLTGINDPTGDVTPWLRLSGSADNCFQNMGNAWRIEADNLAEAQGYSKTAYKFRVILFAPIPNCSLSAMAGVGVFGNPSEVMYSFIQLSPNGTDEDLQDNLFVLIHELEHNFGQSEHSNGQQYEGGPILDTRDNGDSMGSNKLIMNHAVNRIKLGWLTTWQQSRTYVTRGTHRLQLQSPSQPWPRTSPVLRPLSAGFIELRNLDGTLADKVMVLETRTNLAPHDQFGTDTQAYVGGVAVRLVSRNLAAPGTGTLILDSTPATFCCKDAPVVVGRSFTFSTYGVTVTPSRSVWGRVNVTINLGTNYPAG